jgi:predicted nucleic acid-binding protein
LIAIVDTGPLYAAVDEDDQRHERCRDLLYRHDFRVVVPALVVAETTYFVGLRLGPHAEAAFLTGLEGVDIEAPASEDWPRIGELAEQYADFPLGGTDASIVALAERLETDVVITLDRRHFGAIRPRHCETLRLLPD